MAEFKINASVSCGGDIPMDEEMIPVCKLLTEKGYITRSSEAGHPRNIGRYSFLIDNDSLILWMPMFVMFEKDCMHPPPYPDFWRPDESFKRAKWERSPLFFGEALRYHDLSTSSRNYFRVRKATVEEIEYYDNPSTHNKFNRWITECGQYDITNVEDLQEKALKILYQYADSLPFNIRKTRR